MIDILGLIHRVDQESERIFPKVMKAESELPRRVVADRLGYYGVAIQKLLLGSEHLKGKIANNRAETVHKATRNGRGVDIDQPIGSCLVFVYQRSTMKLLPHAELLK